MRRVAGIAFIALLALAIAGSFAGCGCQKDIAVNTTGQIDVAKDAAAKLDLTTIKAGAQAFAASTGQAPADASQATLGGYVNPWPTNPWTQAPMQPGDAVGDYVYTPGADGSFTLAVHLSDGSTFTAP